MKDKLLRLFYAHGFDTLFRGDTQMFLAQVEVESNFNQFALRFEPGQTRHAGFIRNTSFGLWQVMGFNLEYLDREAFRDPALFLCDIDRQARIVRAFYRKCPSVDIIENLHWWNTGRVDQSIPGDRYVNKILAVKHRENREGN